ncbi:MAG TPA: GC-type dockerin domain-anchored protein [Phycisphaerales bacterium]|nr:GC-type dockerin domain-anchored protein [Phycisphaerales bacterium]
MKQAMVLSAVTAMGLLCAAGQAQVVISQVYGGGGNSGGLYDQDFIELKNIGNAPVDITGWTVQQASAGATGGTGNFATSNRASAPFPAMVLQPGQYFLVGGAFGANLAQPDLPTPDVQAPSITAGASDGKVVLVNSNTLVSITNPAHFDQTTFNPIIGGGSPIVDMVGIGTAASHFEGADGTANSSNSLAVVRRNNGCQDTNDNSADFELAAPNPHNSSSTVLCGVAFPDLALQLSNSGCTPTVGSAYTVTAQVSNAGSASANAVTVSVVLPPSLTYVSNTGGGSYNAGTRTVTWNAGTLGSGGATSFDIATTVNAVAGITVTASVSTTTANDPVGNNSASNFNEVLSTDAPLSTILVASSADSSIATVIDEGGTPRQLATIYRAFTSLDGNWIVLRGDLTSGGSEANGVVIVGHNTGSAWTFSIVAHEGPTNTAPDATLPASRIDSNTFGNIQGINNAGEYVYSCRLRNQNGTPADTSDDVLNWAVVKGTVAGGVSMVIKQGDAATAAELSGRTYNILSSSTIQNNGTVSFAATLSGTSATNAAFLSDNGALVRAQKGVTVPGNAATVLDFLDSDDQSDGRGFMVSADGNHWIGTGEVQSPNTTDDNVVVVDGSVAVREGFPVGAFTDAAGWATFGSQQVPWAQMLADGTWFIHGFNPATPGFNQGQDWVMRNGTLLTSTGAPIVPASTETWSDSVLQRTFFLEAGSGDAFVVGGLTNRSAAANGTDTATDGVVVYRGTEVLVREGAPVEVISTDGSQTVSTRYLNLINDNRSFVAGGTLYMAATLRNATSVCNGSFGNLPQALVAVDLPDTNTCPADLGTTGGIPGSDGVLNNNDFVVFIDYFFAQNPLADQGSTGGVPGADGQWNNNDFVVFIDNFFAGCGG